ncbi:actin family [Cryptosporidium sp. chipmunk genotype I]|uniref:actin family n=1 Tax=Cryptosporidium sp. chipmunk genotype I TaxID=1280935 RepID=UPI00351A67DB|nr:actin family [Cryptosporidium sp. chipmunk genotype I]
MDDIGTNKNHIIILLGRRHVKAGFSKKAEPFVILQTSELFSKCVDILEISRNDHTIFSDESDYVTVFKDPINWKRSWSSLIRMLYTDYLMSNPKDYPVILLERPFFPIELSNYIIQILKENYQVPRIRRISEPIVSLFTTGFKTGIVVDIGASETIVCPIYDGYPIEYNVKIIRCGYDDFKKKFKSELFSQYKEKPEEEIIKEISNDLMDDIIFQSGIVNYELNEDNENNSNISDFTYENLIVNDRYINLVVDKNTRTKPFEIFFGDKAFPSAKVIHHIVLDGIIQVLLNSNIETRKELSQNILICGGLASVPGFERRVSSELEALISNEKLLKPLADHFFVTCPPISPFIRSYCGATLMLQHEKISYNFEGTNLQKISSKINSKL